MTFLAGTAAIVLTFLAGAELDPDVFWVKWKEALIVGYHGHSVIFERVMGSTAQSVVRHAPCSVLLAK